MDKTYIKTPIAMRQAEFPTDLKRRENPLPVNEDKIITIPGVRRCGKSSKMEAAPIYTSSPQSNRKKSH